MNNDIQLLVKDIPQTDLQEFLKKTEASATVKQVIHKVSIDFSWVDVLEESIPQLDNIIRNPRRFITQEEDVIPIEKIKRVSEESIKHLAVHTNLIQAVDEDGTVKPIKLLNIFKEETIDLYENRFIYSLINNLYTFVRSQLKYKEEEEENKEEKSVVYQAKTKYKSDNIVVRLDLTTSKDESIKQTAEEKEALEIKINKIKEVLEDFRASQFMKTMANATPVRSPIRKTNVILKDQNFIKAVELWEFLETYQIQKPVKHETVDKELTTQEIINDFSLTYYLNYGILNGNIGTKGISLGELNKNIFATIYEYMKKFQTSEDEVIKEINRLGKEAKKYKAEQKQGVLNAYNSFIENHNGRIDKALLLFK